MEAIKRLAGAVADMVFGLFLICTPSPACGGGLGWGRAAGAKSGPPSGPFGAGFPRGRGKWCSVPQLEHHSHSAMSMSLERT